MYVDIGGRDMVPFLEVLDGMVKRGVEVRLVHAKGTIYRDLRRSVGNRAEGETGVQADAGRNGAVAVSPSAWEFWYNISL